jgi:hypothetical protein
MFNILSHSEMNIKTTLRFSLTPVRMTIERQRERESKREKAETIVGWQGRKRPLCTVCGHVN